MAARRHERYQWIRKVKWDFFTAARGAKSGYITNISQGGCLLKTTELIEHRRWIRIMVQDRLKDRLNGQAQGASLWRTAVGRVIRCEHAIEAVGFSGEETDISLYRYGVEFVQPCFASNQDLALILDLPSKNWIVRSCRSLNTKSS